MLFVTMSSTLRFVSRTASPLSAARRLTAAAAPGRRTAFAARSEARNVHASAESKCARGRDALLPAERGPQRARLPPDAGRGAWADSLAPPSARRALQSWMHLRHYDRPRAQDGRHA